MIHASVGFETEFLKGEVVEPKLMIAQGGINFQFTSLVFVVQTDLFRARLSFIRDHTTFLPRRNEPVNNAVQCLTMLEGGVRALVRPAPPTCELGTYDNSTAMARRPLTV